MKRFFCTVCQRVKRVHRLPDNVRPIIDPETDKVLTYSEGQCRFHGAKQTRAQVNERVAAKHVNVKKSKPVAASKGKGKGK